MAKRRPSLKTSDLLDLVFLSDPAATPAGDRMACVRTHVVASDDAPPRYASAIWASSPASPDALSPLVGGERDAVRPRFSPDGRYLAYLSEPPKVASGATTATPNAGKAVYLLDLVHGGEGRCIATLPGGVQAAWWSADARGLVITGHARAAAASESEVVARTVDRLHGKRDGLPSPGVRDPEPNGAWWVNVPTVDGSGAADPASAPRPLPSPPAGVSDVVMAPDARTIWMLGADDTEMADAWMGRWYRVRVGKRGKAKDGAEPFGPVLLSPGNGTIDDAGTTLAWVAPSDGVSLSAPAGLWTMRTTDASPTPALVSDPDLDVVPACGGDARHGAYPNVPVAHPDGWIVNANREGASGPALLHHDGRLVPWLDGACVATSMVAAGGRALTVVETPRQPGVLTWVSPDGTCEPVYDPNAAWTAKKISASVEGPFHAANGASGVAWWRHRPATPRPDAAIVVQVHGGPHTNAGFGFSFEHHLLAARGFTVVTSNPRGSSSYGHAHATAMLGGYGTIDADDVMAVVDHAVRDHVDAGAPVHLTGGSYGGFMTNWLVTQTDRFQSAVTQRSICNWTSFYGTSDIGYRFAEAEVRGNPWDDLEALWRQSPLAYVANVTTPILVLHAEADHRCPIEQAEQWYVALKKIGHADTRLVRFPQESHELSRSGRPDRRMRRLEEIYGWFEAHA